MDVALYRGAKSGMDWMGWTTGWGEVESKARKKDHQRCKMDPGVQSKLGPMGHPIFLYRTITGERVEPLLQLNPPSQALHY